MSLKHADPERYRRELDAIAERRGVTPIEAYIDAMVDSDGRSIVNWPVMNQDDLRAGMAKLN